MIRTKMSPLVETMRLLLAFSRGNEHDRLTHQNHRHLNIQGLLDAGLIRPGEYERSYYCDSCFEFGEVTWHELPDGSHRIVNRCECSIYPLKPEQLRSWRVVTPVLIQRLGEAMEFKPPFTEVLPKLVWSFGRKSRREFYFVGGMTYENESAVKGFFAAYPTAVLLAAMTPTKQSLADLLPNHLCFSLEAITALDDSFQVHVDMTSIETEIVPVPDVKKKPAPRRGHRAANIEKLIHELEQHILTARDHVWETGNLLPRPSMQELGKLAGIEKHDVTRCMKDDDAVKLRYLWKVANDIKMVQDWKG